ncbi:hypothetical protein [Rothia sp. P4278]|uniref:hypothetical protein n=1 Tax=Rothia sp. P4278 TaxID=3402658 RepID=UPI003AE0CB03
MKTNIKIVLSLGLTSAMLLAGCGATKASNNEPTATAESSATASQQVIQSPTTAEPSLSTEATSPSSSASSISNYEAQNSPSASDNIKLSGPSDSMVLDDFAAHSNGWKDGTFSVAGETMTGIGTKLDQCIEAPQTNDLGNGFSHGEETLRLNLGHKYSSLKFKAGQNIGSQSMDQVLAIRITDGTKQIGEIHTVHFDEITPIEIDTTNRSVIFIQMYIQKTGSNSCSSKSIEPVIYNVSLS